MPSWGQCPLRVGGTSWWPAPGLTDVSLRSSVSCLTAPAVAEREGSPSPADTVGPASFSSRPSVWLHTFWVEDRPELHPNTASQGGSHPPPAAVRAGRVRSSGRFRVCLAPTSAGATASSPGMRTTSPWPRASGEPGFSPDCPTQARTRMRAASHRHNGLTPAAAVGAACGNHGRSPLHQPGDGQFCPQCCRAEASPRAL